MAIFETATGIPKLRHLPTNGGGPAITAMLGNNAQMSAQAVTPSLQHIKSGKLRALASFGAERSKALPDVPTLKELGYDVEYYLWVGLFAPKGTPDSAVKKLSAALDQAANSEPFKAAIAAMGQEFAYLNASDFAKFWDADARRAEAAVKSIGRQG